MRKKILLVDDDETVIEVLNEALRHEGFHTVQAINGEEGVARALTENPDLVISDIVMPRMDGWELCQALRSLPSTKATPFIFLTSLDKTPVKILAERLGADEFLTKPFRIELLLNKVRELLGRLSRRDEVLEGKGHPLRGEKTENILVDTVEFLRATGRTGVVAVEAGPSAGTVYLDKGLLKHASFGEAEGEEALLEMLRLGNSDVSYTEGARPSLTANFSMTWQEFMSSLMNQG